MKTMKSRSKLRNFLKLGPSDDEMEEQRVLHEAILREFDGNEEYTRKYGNEIELSIRKKEDGKYSISFNNSSEYLGIAREAASKGDSEKSLVFYNLAIKRAERFAENDKGWMSFAGNLREAGDYAECAEIAREAGMPEREKHYLENLLDVYETHERYSDAIRIAKKLNLEERVKAYKKIISAKKKLRII
jgi:tetratricopeptide (TPR) repeat protein